jgi:carboxymethylenebutenolidase
MRGVSRCEGSQGFEPISQAKPFLDRFLALAPDLFYWGGRWTCLFSFIRDWAKPLGDMDAARAWLAGRNDYTGRTGVIGFCMGGGLALMLAADHAFSVASANYGGLSSDSKRALPRACPIVASYGAKDRWPGISILMFGR